MNTRIRSIVVAVTLLSLTSGCSGMRNFLFGRGARCGTCSAISGPASNPGYDNRGQAPCSPESQSPCNQSVVGVPHNGCGCNAAYGSAYAGQCECGGETQYTTDPYLSGGTMPYEGQIIGETVTGGQVYPNSVAPIQPDGFDVRARKFDSDGNRILWEEPLPPNTSL